MRVSPTAPTHSVAAATSTARPAAARRCQASTTRVPITTIAIVACPDGSDSFVACTSWPSSGGRGRSSSSFSPRKTSPAPLIAPTASTASARRPANHSQTPIATASTAIATVLPRLVTATAAAASRLVRDSTDSPSTTASRRAGPTPVNAAHSPATDASPSRTAMATPRPGRGAGSDGAPESPAGGASVGSVGRAIPSYPDRSGGAPPHLPVAAHQRRGGGVETRGVGLVRDQHRAELLGKDLAQLHAPLVERVDAPDRALDECDVLVEGDDLAERGGGQLRREDGGRRPVARHHLVRHHLGGGALGGDLFGGLAERQRLGLGEQVGHKQVVHVAAVVVAVSAHVDRMVGFGEADE